MEAALLRQLVAVESAPAHMESTPLRPPQRTVTKTYPAVPALSRRESPPPSIELARISRPATYAAGGGCYDDHPHYHSSGSATPVDLDLEMSRPASPVAASRRHLHEPRDEGVEALQNVWDPYMNRFRLLSACCMNLMNGMSDSASGPLLPYMERYVSLINTVIFNSTIN